MKTLATYRDFNGKIQLRKALRCFIDLTEVEEFQSNETFEQDVITLRFVVV